MINEYLGALYILNGIASLALASLIPTRASGSASGTLLWMFFVFNALERFTAGYNRLVGATVTPDPQALRVMVWSVGGLLTLIAMIVYAWHAPERKPKNDKSPGE